MMMGKKSVPKSAVARIQKKTVKIHCVADREGRPSWRFSSVDKEGDFAWPKGNSEEAMIVEKLHLFDSMLWSDIQGKQHHFLSPDSLSEEAKKRLEKIGRDDQIEHLFSFHLDGKRRIICIRDRDLALLLWYDPEHQVAPSQKKHT